MSQDSNSEISDSQIHVYSEHHAATKMLMAQTVVLKSPASELLGVLI